MSLEEGLAPLTEGQLNVLELMLQFEPMKPSDLLQHLSTTPAAITTLLDRMERNELIVRTRDDNDRRIVWVSVSDKGRAEAERGREIRSKLFEESLDRISAHNQQLLVYLLGESGKRIKAAACKSCPKQKPALRINPVGLYPEGRLLFTAIISWRTFVYAAASAYSPSHYNQQQRAARLSYRWRMPLMSARPAEYGSDSCCPAGSDEPT